MPKLTEIELGAWGEHQFGSRVPDAFLEINGNDRWKEANGGTAAQFQRQVDDDLVLVFWVAIPDAKQFLSRAEGDQRQDVQRELIR